MDRLNELHAEEAALLQRSKVMLDTFPGSSWSIENQAEWNRNMHRLTQVGTEIKALEASADRRNPKVAGAKVAHSIKRRP
jgi:hypothetical protein